MQHVSELQRLDPENRWRDLTERSVPAMREVTLTVGGKAVQTLIVMASTFSLKWKTKDSFEIETGHLDLEQ